jgi:hypothetical protein
VEVFPGEGWRGKCAEEEEEEGGAVGALWTAGVGNNTHSGRELGSYIRGEKCSISAFFILCFYFMLLLVLASACFGWRMGCVFASVGRRKVDGGFSVLKHTLLLLFSICGWFTILRCEGLLHSYIFVPSRHQIGVHRLSVRSRDEHSGSIAQVVPRTAANTPRPSDNALSGTYLGLLCIPS